MATYNWTLVQQDILGTNENIQVSGEVSQLNSFLNSTRNENFVISSLNLFSDNPQQLRQPITIIKDDPDGNGVKIVKVPQLDSYQTQQTSLNNFDIGNFPFDGESKFDFKILPGTILKITLNIDSQKRVELSNKKIFMKALGINDYIKDSVIKSMGFEEVEEQQKTVKQPTLHEPEESKLKSLKVEDVPKITDKTEPEEEKKEVVTEVKKVAAKKTVKKKKKETKKPEEKFQLIEKKWDTGVFSIMLSVQLITLMIYLKNYDN